MEVSLCAWNFIQCERGLPFSSASWTRLRENTVPYLLYIAIGAPVKEGLSSMNVL